MKPFTHYTRGHALFSEITPFIQLHASVSYNYEAGRNKSMMREWLVFSYDFNMEKHHFFLTRKTSNVL